MSNQNDRPQATGDPAVDRALAILQALPPREQRQPLQVSAGAGIAIAGAWLAGSSVTIAIMIIAFVLKPVTDLGLEIDGWAAVGFIFLVASPMIAAYSISKVILSKD